MNMLVQLIIFALFHIRFSLSKYGKNKIDIVYYELPPYIYSTKNGSVRGIFPQIIEELSVKCRIEFNYSLNMISARNFFSLMEHRNNTKSMTGDWLFLPLNLHIPQDIIAEFGFESVPILQSGIDILVHRDQIGVFAKIKVGIFECRYLFLIGLMLSIIFGVLIWFIERWKNTDFSKNTRGVFTGLWLGIVTMTTVGYGDIAPRSTVGKLLTVAWMVTGIILTAILTSTMTTVFGGLDHLDIYHKKVVALDGSLEAWIASKVYFATLRNVLDYEQLFDGMAQRKYDIGVVDSHVRRDYQSKLDDIRAVKKLSSQNVIPWLQLENRSSWTFFDLKYCMRYTLLHKSGTVSHKYEHILEKEQMNIELDLIEFFSEPSMFTISTLAAACILLCLLIESVMFIRKCMKGEITSLNVIEQAKVSDLAGFGLNQGNGSTPLQLQMYSNILKMDKKIDAFGDDISSMKATLNYLSKRQKLK